MADRVKHYELRVTPATTDEQGNDRQAYPAPPVVFTPKQSIGDQDAVNQANIDVPELRMRLDQECQQKKRIFRGFAEARLFRIDGNDLEHLVGEADQDGVMHLVKG